MDYAPKIESGLQLFARLLQRPPISNFNEELFFEGLSNASIIEIMGSVSSGKTQLLTNLMTKFILPKSCTGLDSKVLLVNTENHFRINYLVQAVHKELLKFQGSADVNEAKSLVIENLRIFNCFDHNQLLEVLRSLDNVFIKDKRIAFLAIDSIGTYFWQQQNEDFRLGLPSYTSYLKKMAEVVQASTRTFRIITAYTRTSDFGSKRSTAFSLATYRIKLEKKPDNEDDFSCNIFTSKNTKQLSYKLGHLKFEWL